MIRGHDPRWQALRRDKRSGFATFATVAAWLPVVVGIIMLSAPDTQTAARGGPLFWLILIPFAWWATALSRYGERPVRFIRHAQAGAPVGAVVVLAIAAAMGLALVPFAVAVVLSSGLAVLAWWLYGGSLLRERQRDRGG